MRNILSFLPLVFNFFMYSVSAFIGCLQNVLIVSDFQQFEYDMPMMWELFWEGEFILLRVLWTSWNCDSVSNSFGKILTYYFLMSLLSGMPITCRLDLLLLSHISWMLCCIFPSTFHSSTFLAINATTVISLVSVRESQIMTNMYYTLIMCWWCKCCSIIT